MEHQTEKSIDNTNYFLKKWVMKTRFRAWQCHLLFVCLLILYGSTASAYDFSFDGIYYNYKDGELEVAGADSNIQDVIIPSQVEYKGKIWMVTSIGENAFSRSNILSIIIPNTVTSIGERAFAYCSKMASINIPNSVKEICDGAFFRCLGLKKLIIEDGTEILSLGQDATLMIDGTVNGSGLFKDCPLDLVYLGRDLKVYIDANYNSADPFEKNKTLSKVTIGDCVKSIPHSTFSGCTSLTSVTIGNSVETIGGHAFYDCYNLSKITMGESIATIGYGAFYNCSMQEIALPNTVQTIEDSAFDGCVRLVAINIPDSVNSIGECALRGCSNLKSIKIPNSVKKIEYETFYECSSLTSIEIACSVTLIEDKVFDGCTSLKHLVFENGTEKLSLGNSHDQYESCGPRGLFYDCPLESIKLGRDLTYTRSPFLGNDNINSVSIAGCVTVLGKELFSCCEGFTDIIIPQSVKSIGDECFYGCKIKNLIIEDCSEPLIVGNGLGFWDGPDGMFSRSPLQTVYLGRNISYSVSPFKRTNMLSSITISNNVTAIENELLEDCTELKSVSLPNSIISIEKESFKGCCGLTQFIIPNSVTSIGERAFMGCENLSSISIPATITSIGAEAFKECEMLKYLYFENGTNSLAIGDNVFLDCSLETVYIGRNLNCQGTLFDKIISLTNVQLSNNVESIGDSFFFECTGLMSIEIPNSVKTIGNNAFSGCENLRSISIPNSVLSIGDASFKGCSGLTSISFGKSLHEIGKEAFSGCNPDTIESFSYKLEGIEASGLSRKRLITIKTDSDFSGIGSTNLTYFNQVVLKDRNNNEEYVLVTSPLNMNFSNSVFQEMNNYIIPIKECNAKYANDNQYIAFRGKDITNSIKSADGFSFIPSIYHSKNVFSVYGDADDSSLSRTINLDQAGTLFDKLDFENIEKIQALTLSGNINGTDIMTINRMTALKYLDISNARIVEGGVTYRDNLKTVDNVIGERFFNDIGLEVLHLPNTIYKIEHYAFTESPLKVVTIPPSAKELEHFAFLGCPALTSISIPGSVTSIGFEAFVATPLEEVRFEDGEEDLTIGFCFGNSPQMQMPVCLKTLYLGRNIKYDDSSPFALPSLTNITISKCVTAIGKGEFQRTGIRHITLPESVTTIEPEAFAYCTELGSVVIPQSVSSIGYSAFENCNRLCSVSVPKNLEKIEANVFNGCSALTEFLIPERVSSIGWSAFENCKGLTSIQIPQSVLTIRDNAFKGCSSLTEANIPDRITSIGDFAFYNTALKEVLLPASVKSIGDYAFGGNTGISKVISLNSTPPEIYANTFDSEVEASAPLYVQKGSLMYYWLDPVWKEFTNISDNVLCLETIPNMRYGDDEIDLSQYAPEGVSLTYKSSNVDVVKIKDTKMQIVGAGKATISAIQDEVGTHSELVGQLRQIFVDKADLIVTVDEIAISEGSPIPDFTYIAEGLQYDDTLDDIDNLPQPVHEVDENSPKGEYVVSFTEGSDRNYRISTKPSKITVTERSEVEDNLSEGGEPDIEVYDLNGLCIFHGVRNGVILGKGIYIVRQGDTVKKVIVK